MGVALSTSGCCCCSLELLSLLPIPMPIIIDFTRSEIFGMIFLTCSKAGIGPAHHSHCTTMQRGEATTRTDLVIFSAPFAFSVSQRASCLSADDGHFPHQASSFLCQGMLCYRHKAVIALPAAAAAIVFLSDLDTATNRASGGGGC